MKVRVEMDRPMIVRNWRCQPKEEFLDSLSIGVSILPAAGINSQKHLGYRPNCDVLVRFLRLAKHFAEI